MLVMVIIMIDNDGMYCFIMYVSCLRPRPFKIDVHTVTNAQFADFVNKTKYKTVAEDFKWSFVLE